MTKEMLTTDDLADYLQIHKNRIYRLIRERRLPATRITGKWLFPKQLVDEWVKDSAREMVRTEQRFPSLTVSLSNISGHVWLLPAMCHDQLRPD